ncbi:4-demethylwyosine synthase TYW1 [archaeon]|jgi:tRNA wybutosine-synthesizing protein 1|nr:4-demethylwyosine synthase TYW1 [archaeon]MBT7128876.1 4-demethylwyosine synthase TYW1 [archaeon]
MARDNPKRKCEANNVRDKLEKMNYGLVGETSAVQICRWTKNSLKGDRGCWKEKFYGIKSSGCVQMTPSVMWCENKCLHCWRPIEMNLGTELPSVDDPVEILDGIVAKRREMLQGMKGNADVDSESFEKDIEPSLFTMSLSGESTLYPRLGEMFAEIRRRGAVSFLVSNGLNPEAIKRLERVERKNEPRTTRTNADNEKMEQDFVSGLPTQLVISCNAPNEELFLKWHRSSVRDAWVKFGESLDVMRELKGKVRRVVRLTLVKEGSEGEFGEMSNMVKESGVGGRELGVGEDDMIDEYVSLIKRAEPDFVHVKGYKAVGYAKERMGYDNQVWHEGIKEFARALGERLGDFSVGAEDDRSCVVALVRKSVDMKIKFF